MILTLKNEMMEAQFESEYGKLIGLKHFATNWTIQQNTTNAASFEMLIPVPGKQCNPVYGIDNPVSHFEQRNNQITFVWDGISSELTGKLDIMFTATVTLNADGLSFNAEAENHSPYVIEDIKYPFLGEIERPEGNKRIDQMNWVYGGMKVEELYPNFDYTRGYWGRVYPLQQVNVPQSNFSLFCAEKQGIYFGCHDSHPSKMAVFCYEARPAVAGSFVCNLENQFDRDVYHTWLNFFATHLLYIQPGHKASISPIVVCPFEGSWHKGMDIYRKWRSTWYRAPQVPKWALEPHAWYEIQMCNYGEGYRFNYKDLIKLGRDCVKHGIKALQIVGWTREGQDGCLPDHSIEPRLGTLEDLKDAIAQVEAMGVKVVLYTKYLFADTRTDWFRNELQHYACRDKYGDILSFEGYYYENISDLTGINTHRLANMCLQSEKYREICKKQFEYCMDIGASGIIYDEPMFHHEMPYCFDPSHGHGVPASNFYGDLLLAKDLSELSREKGNEDFLFMCEDGWDLQHQYYGFSYFRISTHNIAHHSRYGYIPVQRYVDPYFPILNAVWGHDDRDGINMNIMLRFITSYEPYQFKGHLEDMPLTLNYGKLADDLRVRYRSYLWDAEFRDTQDATVLNRGGVQHYPYAVYNRQDGKQAVVLVNLTDEPVELDVTLGNGQTTYYTATPETPDKESAERTVVVKPRGLTVVMED